MNNLVQNFAKDIFNVDLSIELQHCEKFDIAKVIDDSGNAIATCSEVLSSASPLKMPIMLGFAVRETILCNNLLSFIREFESNTINEHKLRKYKKKLENPKKLAAEVGRLIKYIDGILDEEKVDLLAYFYRSYIEDLIDWSVFCELSDVVSRIFVSDIKLLKEIYEEKVKTTNDCYGYQADRLISLGLVESSPLAIYPGGYGRTSVKRNLMISALGKTFYKMGGSKVNFVYEDVIDE